MKPSCRPLTYSALLALLALALPACTVMRKVERLVPEIPEIVLIGEKKPTITADDPESLVPDLEKDVAVFKVNVQGQNRRIVIQLYPDDAPMTVANFQQHVRSGHYEGMAVHRAIPNYLVQMGDPQSKRPDTRAAWGTGGLETTIPAEIRLRHRLGTVGMARLGDASNASRSSSGSQFYIALGDMRKFDGDYTVFGQVIQGYDTLQTISEFPADENDNPYQRLEIRSAQLDESRRYTPEDIDGLHRQTRRRSVQEIPTANDEGVLKRTWRQIW